MRRAPGAEGWKAPRGIAIAAGIWGTLSCVGSQAAVPIAAQRAGCPVDKVVEIEKSTNVALLDVCGTVERWEWDAFDGYQYTGKAADPRRRPAAALQAVHRVESVPPPRSLPAPAPATSAAVEAEQPVPSDTVPTPVPPSQEPPAATPPVGQAGAGSTAPAPGPAEL